MAYKTTARSIRRAQSRRNARTRDADAISTAKLWTTIRDRSKRGKMIKAQWKRTKGAGADIFPIDTKGKGRKRSRKRRRVVR